MIIQLQEHTYNMHYEYAVIMLIILLKLKIIKMQKQNHFNCNYYNSDFF